MSDIDNDVSGQSANMTWREAIAFVLRAEGTAMRPNEIAEGIVARNLRSSYGATPEATVGSNLAVAFRDDPDCEWRKVAPSTYIHRDASGEQPVSPAVAGSKSSDEAAAAQSSTTDANSFETSTVESDTDSASREQSAGVIRALGMFWARDMVHWQSGVSLLGRQGVGADPIDLSQQAGVYLLHDRREVIYVGRAIADSLGTRLLVHTGDRLAGRWDRFSWFGVREVREDGSLSRIDAEFGLDSVITAFEAILIEALEPRQNRRRGDMLTGVEFLQVEDPELEKTRNRNFLQKIAAKM